jgi:hypothetical protein
LFNGGVKTSQKVQDSPALFSKFNDANRFAKRITQAIKDGEIIINEARHQLLPNGEDEIIL